MGFSNNLKVVLQPNRSISRSKIIGPYRSEPRHVPAVLDLDALKEIWYLLHEQYYGVFLHILYTARFIIVTGDGGSKHQSTVALPAATQHPHLLSEREGLYWLYIGEKSSGFFWDYGRGKSSLSRCCRDDELISLE
jgi:hypothetical protein